MDAKLGNIHRVTITCILLDTICISLDGNCLHYYQFSANSTSTELWDSLVKDKGGGTSLAVQWLKTSCFLHRGHGFHPWSGELRSHMLCSSGPPPKKDKGGDNPVETMHLRLGLKPSQNSDWDLNPRGRDLNPAKIRIGTWTHEAGTWTWPKPTVFQLRSHTWFQNLMKLRFLMSHRRKNSVRDKVIDKKWIYLERNTLHRQECGPSQKVRKTPG